jgi:hypothetical protein
LNYFTKAEGWVIPLVNILIASWRHNFINTFLFIFGHAKIYWMFHHQVFWYCSLWLLLWPDGVYSFTVVTNSSLEARTRRKRYTALPYKKFDMNYMHDAYVIHVSLAIFIFGYNFVHHKYLLCRWLILLDRPFENFKISMKLSYKFFVMSYCRKLENQARHEVLLTCANKLPYLPFVVGVVIFTFIKLRRFLAVLLVVFT